MESWNFLVLNVEKNYCFWASKRIIVGTLLSAIMLRLFDKAPLYMSCADNMLPLPRPLAPFRRSTTLDHLSCWAKLHQFKQFHLLYWAHLSITISMGDHCWTTIFQEGPLSVIASVTLFSSWKHTSFVNATCAECSIFYFKFITCIFSSSTEVCIFPILEWIPRPVAHM